MLHGPIILDLASHTVGRGYTDCIVTNLDSTLYASLIGRIFGGGIAYVYSRYDGD